MRAHENGRGQAGCSSPIAMPLNVAASNSGSRALRKHRTGREISGAASTIAWSAAAHRSSPPADARSGLGAAPGVIAPRSSSARGVRHAASALLLLVESTIVTLRPAANACAFRRPSHHRRYAARSTIGPSQCGRNRGTSTVDPIVCRDVALALRASPRTASSELRRAPLSRDASVGALRLVRVSKPCSYALLVGPRAGPTSVRRRRRRRGAIFAPIYSGCFRHTARASSGLPARRLTRAGDLPRRTAPRALPRTDTALANRAPTEVPANPSSPGWLMVAA